MYAGGCGLQAAVMPDPHVLPGFAPSCPLGAEPSADRSADPPVAVDWASEFQAQARPIRRWLTRRLGSVVEAEDIVQETFLLAHQLGHRFRGDSRSSTWLYGIALNLSKRWRFTRGASPPLNACDEVWEETGLLHEPGRGLASRQMLAALNSAMTALPATQSEVLWLIAVEGMGAEEIAVHLHITPAAVRSRLSRARARLRESLNLS